MDAARTHGRTASVLHVGGKKPICCEFWHLTSRLKVSGVLGGQIPAIYRRTRPNLEIGSGVKKNGYKVEIGDMSEERSGVLARGDNT